MVIFRLFSGSFYLYVFPKYTLTKVTPRVSKNLVFAMTVKLIPEVWRNQEIHEKFWKTYEQMKLDLFQIFNLFLILVLIPEFCHPEPRPTTLQSYLTYYV